jgi:hypothetical protein
MGYDQLFADFNLIDRFSHKACLQKICRWALQREKMKVNPCVGVDKCEVLLETVIILDFEQTRLLFS